MSGHTPGPWWVSKEVDGYAAGCSTWVRDLIGRQIASTHNQIRSEIQPQLIEAEANAHLIAAAPDLLEALRECADRLRVHMKHTEDLVADMKAQKAIAKAEGR